MKALAAMGVGVFSISTNIAYAQQNGSHLNSSSSGKATCLTNAVEEELYLSEGVWEDTDTISPQFFVLDSEYSDDEQEKFFEFADLIIEEQKDSKKEDVESWANRIAEQLSK